MNTYLAVDLGGTFMKYALITEEGTIQLKEKTKSPVSIDDLVETVGRLSEKLFPVKAVTMSSPGAVTEEGVVQGSSALPYLHGPNIKNLLQKRVQLPVYMENDANCAAYAEVWKGAGSEVRNMLSVVIGTGIGGAIIKDGVLHRGNHLHGGEFGYMLLNTEEPGFNQTWSGLASTQALVRRFANAKQKNSEDYTGEDIFRLADEHDQEAVEAVEKFYYYVAAGIYNLQYMYDPELITIGGGISAREDLITKVNEKLDVIMASLPLGKIKPAIAAFKFRQHSNLLGAVYHGRLEEMKKE
ncbi:sugar kinase [Marinococcus halophilus]|uniref:Transcriptional regulator n=1 Tax=Marinococcus halophilus TaxID=1371 RepID=A0A510YAH2_MARHA|nr:ROK family protein [Marinococcus halophilus]OZT80713.1 sugar kinase [Marinococcus halophilus]GEK59681.1 transcriptional regulator [Marinococcus halophilus]